MAIVATTIPALQDIMEQEAEKELWIVGRLFERPPYFHAGKGGDTRLARALRLCLDGRITPNSDGSYKVEGSEGRTYRVAEACSCPQSQHAQSKYCYHYVAVCLYIEWKRRLRTMVPPLGTQVLASDPDDDQLEGGNGYPVDDETLPLPLPPTSVEERLAQAASVAMDAVYTALAPQTPQEDPMTEDPSPYIPEPDEATTAVLAPQTVTIERPGGRPTTVALAPQDDDLERALQVWTQQRQVVQRFLKQELIAGTDYYSLRIGNRDSKPSLSKAGAEKVLGWLRWSASFVPDTQTWEMLGRPQDVVIYICTLRTRSGEIVGEGRGARSLKKDGGDINKAMKMASKSAQVDAVLRTGCLSDCFTQDLEDAQEETPPASPRQPTARPTSQELRQRIWTLVQAVQPAAASREAVERYVQETTGYPLHPDRYAEIVSALEAR